MAASIVASARIRRRSPFAATASSAHKTGIGFAEASAIGNPATFAGQAADSTSVLIRYTYYGDANLDKTVDLTDFTFLASNFNGTGKVWNQGDFNYDGAVDLTDFTLLASNFNQTLPDEALGANVPEPQTLALAAAIGFIAARRRR